MKYLKKVTPSLCIGGGLIIYTLPKVKYFKEDFRLNEEISLVIKNIIKRKTKRMNFKEAKIISQVLNPLIRDKFFVGVYRINLLNRFNTSLIREENRSLRLKYLSLKFKIYSLKLSLLENNKNYLIDEPICIHLLVDCINSESYWRKPIDIIDNECFLISFCYWILNINQLSNVWITNFTYSRDDIKSIKSRWSY